MVLCWAVKAWMLQVDFSIFTESIVCSTRETLDFLNPLSSTSSMIIWLLVPSILPISSKMRDLLVSFSPMTYFDRCTNGSFSDDMLPLPESDLFLVLFCLLDVVVDGAVQLGSVFVSKSFLLRSRVMYSGSSVLTLGSAFVT